MRYFLSCLCITTLLASQKLVLSDMYYYNDPEGISLHRPAMDYSETLLMGEHDPGSKDGSLEFREIIFYLKSDSNHNQKYLRKSVKTKKKKRIRTLPLFSQYGQWSPTYDSTFTYIQVKDVDFTSRIFNLLEINIHGLKSRNPDLLSKTTRIINQEDIIFSPYLIKYYNTVNNTSTQEDNYFIIYTDDQGRDAIVSNSEIFSTNSNMVYNIYLSDGDSLITINPILKDPIEIQINTSNLIYPHPDVLLTVKGSLESEKDIYYFCTIDDISDGTAIAIQKGKALLNQFDAKFSFDGKYISYINQRDTETFELMVMLRPQYNRIADCIENETMNKNSFIETEHITIDEILTYDSFGFDAFRYYAYAWHPEANIIFYIVDNGMEDVIKYYNFNNKKRGIVKTNTNANRYVSVSPKGNYLLYTFSGHDDETFHFKNCIYNNRANNLNCCGNKTKGHNIGVVEIDIR